MPAAPHVLDHERVERAVVSRSNPRWPPIRQGRFSSEEVDDARVVQLVAEYYF